MLGQKIKMILGILFLVFVFIDAANIVDLFSNTEVVHYEEGSPSNPDLFGLSTTSFSTNVCNSLNSFSKTNLQRHSKKKSSFSKLLIFDQDSPSVIHEVESQDQSIANIEPSNQTKPLDHIISTSLYINNCSLQI